MSPGPIVRGGGPSVGGPGHAGPARVYRTSPWGRGALALALATFAGGAAALAIFDVLPDRGMSVVLLMCAAFTWYGWSLMRRRRVIVDDGGITLVEWRKPVRLELAEVGGFRRSYSNNAVTLHLETRTPGRTVPVRMMASMDAAFDAWLRRIPALDQGAGSPERAAFDRDRPTARVVNRVALALGACALLPFGGAWAWVAAVPFLMPFVALAVVVAGRGRFTIAERGKDDPRPTLALTFIGPPLAAALRPIFQFETLSMGPVFAAGVAVAAVLCALAWLCDRTLRGRRAWILLPVLLLMTIPSASALLLVNCASDGSPAEARSTIVLRRIHRTGRGGGYFLELAPWEPTMEKPEERRVSRTLYERALAGRPVTVLTRPGRLGFRWAWVDGAVAATSRRSPPSP